MDILADLQQIAMDKSKDYDKDLFFVRGQWGVELVFRPNIHERTFQYQVIVIQTLRQGASYCSCTRRTVDPKLMAQDARTVRTDDRCMNVAMLDAAYSVFEDESVKDFYLDGTSMEKAVERADIVASEVLYQMPEHHKLNAPSVVNVGVVGNIIRQLRERGVEVYATDLDPELVGNPSQGVIVQDGIEHTLELVEKCDVALITGMVLSTHTLGEILEVARKAHTKVVMFAETGAWFGQTYCDHFGIDAVVSEPFPFYIFAGRSLIRLHRAEK